MSAYEPQAGEVVLEGDFLDAALKLAGVQAMRAQLAKDELECKEILAKVLAEGETGIDANGTKLAQVKRGARVWNEAQAKENLPEHVLANITRTETVTRTFIDQQLAKDTLAPVLYDKCCKRNRPSVVAL